MSLRRQTSANGRTLVPISITVFGETKSAYDWSKDDRCEITYTTLSLRIKGGFPVGPDILKRKESNSPLVARFDAYATTGPRLGTFATIKEAEQAILTAGGEGRIVDKIIRRIVPIPRVRVAANPYKERRMVTAWGKEKSLYEWSRSPECAVGLETLYARFRAKRKRWTPEDAISQPARQCYVGDIRKGSAQLYKGFGEEKDLYHWARDPRCEVARGTLKKRLRGGVPVEQAVQRGDLKPRTVQACLSGVFFTAFNQTKPFAEWARDPRCEVSRPQLRIHIQSGMPMQLALLRQKSGPPKTRTRPPVLDPSVRVQTLTLFGETKTAGEWAKDPRADIGYKTIIERIRRGWDRDDAKIIRAAGVYSALRKRFQALLSDGTDLGRFSNVKEAASQIEARTGLGIVKDVTSGREISIPRPKKISTNPNRHALKITAWDETKTGAEWSRDPRCKVSLNTLYTRLKSRSKDWTSEEAISTPHMEGSHIERIRTHARRYAGFGKEKTIDEWAADPRCEIGISLLGKRLRAGIPVSMALKSGARKRPANIMYFAALRFTAFGEEKTFNDWLADPRCEVSATQLRLHIKEGMSMEDALKKKERAASVPLFKEGFAVDWDRRNKLHLGS